MRPAVADYNHAAAAFHRLPPHLDVI